jgi:plastocyanin
VTGTRSATVRYALAAAVVAALAAGAACFSERQEATSPAATGDCRLPLDSGVVGRTQVVVAIRNFAFVPAEVRVAPGTTVVWVNCEGADIDPHTSTADGGAWDSGFLRPGESYSRTFDEAGSFSYHCTPHPFMRGTVAVE